MKSAASQEHSPERMRRIAQAHQKLADAYPLGTTERIENLQAAAWWREMADKIDKPTK